MNVNDVANEYFSYIKENTQMNLIKDGHTEVVTPFVDSSGEGISFSITFDGSLYTISDDGFTTWELELSGIDVNKRSKRREIFLSQVEYNGFVVSKSGIISKKVAHKELGQSIHDMTQLLVNIYDLTYLAQSNVYQQFYEDVAAYFKDNSNYAVFPNFNVTGKSHFNHRFNYVFLQNGKNKFAKVFNRLDRQQVNNILTSWLDTTLVREKEYGGKEELYIILSKEGFKELNDDIILALDAYDIQPLDFSNKKDLTSNLGA